MESNAPFKVGDRVSTTQSWANRFNFSAQLWGTIDRIVAVHPNPYTPERTHRMELGYPLQDGIEYLWFDPTDLEPFTKGEPS